jgi:hypothetical protein
MTTFSIEHLSHETLELPANMAGLLKAEAKARRKSPLKLLSEIIEDLADARAADKSEKASKGKPQVTLEQLANPQ